MYLTSQLKIKMNVGPLFFYVIIRLRLSCCFLKIPLLKFSCLNVFEERAACCAARCYLKASNSIIPVLNDLED